MTEFEIPAPQWGPQGEEVFRRTYARTNPDGTLESWAECVRRVVKGNLALVYGTDEDTWAPEVHAEAVKLCGYMYTFAIVPAGRHLWCSGVPGQQFLSNCFVAGWTDRLSEHLDFVMMRLSEGGGVGSNYSERPNYPPPPQPLQVHFVCSAEHADHAAMRTAGVLSTVYSDDWQGAYAVEDSREGWSAALVDMVDTYFRADVRHTNRVYDLSHIRPAGARLKRFGGTASGPLPFAQAMLEIADVLNHRAEARNHVTAMDLMRLDHSIAKAIVAGGVRRSARMSILDWRDPEIYTFIDCKRDTNEFWTSNLSIGIDDTFVKYAGVDGSPASLVYQAAVRGMYVDGEPGFVNLEKAARGEFEPIHACNPCGEQFLPAWGSCNLGHVNLSAFAGADPDSNAAEMVFAHRLMARFLVRATFGDQSDPKQATAMARDRRIGVGHFGVQTFLAQKGLSYSSTVDNDAFAMLLRSLYDSVRSAARSYSFELRIPEPIKVTTVAPTGSIAKLSGVSEGIHPIYSKYFIRRIRFSSTNPDQVARVAELQALGHKVEKCQYADDTVVVEYVCEDPLVGAVRALGLDESLVEGSDELSLDTMLAFQAMYQKHWADNAVSMTANFDPDRVSEREVSQALLRWLGSVKGTTIFAARSRPQSPYEAITKGQYEASQVQEVDNGGEDCTNGCPIR